MFKAIKKVLSKIKDIAIKSLNVFYDFVEEVEEEIVAVEEVRLEEKKLYLDMTKFVMNWLSSGARYVLETVSNATKAVLETVSNATKAVSNEVKMISNNNKSVAKVGAFGFSLVVASALTIFINNVFKT